VKGWRRWWGGEFVTSSKGKEMEKDRTGHQADGHLVFRTVGTSGRQRLEEVRRYDTKEEAIEAAQAWVSQKEGNEAFVTAAEAHYYNPLKPKNT